MATLSGMLVADKSSALDSGAAFVLDRKCDVNKVFNLKPNWEIEVKEGCDYIVTRFQGATSADDAFNKGHEAIQQGLDLLSITSTAHLSIRNAAGVYLVWWREQPIQILRITSIIPLYFQSELKKTDRYGNPISDPLNTQSVYHESFRYFRLSQVTDDLFDAFRNMYLAFEILLDSIVPKEQNEGEGKWLKRAIRELENRNLFSNVSDYINKNFVEILHEYIYKNIRCCLFHSKKEPYLRPQNLADQEIVREGLKILTEVVISLAKNHYHVQQRMISPKHYSFFEHITEQILINSKAIISDDDNPIDSIEQFKISEEKKVVSMQTTKLNLPSNALFTLELEQLKILEEIKMVGLIHEEKLRFCMPIQSALTSKNIDRLEAEISFPNLQKRSQRFFSR